MRNLILRCVELLLGVFRLVTIDCDRAAAMREEAQSRLQIQKARFEAEREAQEREAQAKATADAEAAKKAARVRVL